jgi:AmiR/NasT family two-component response regulator
MIEATLRRVLARPPVAYPAPAFETDHLRVLVAHADLDGRRFYLDAITNLGHEACPASCGDEAAVLGHDLCPDVVIVDSRLPGLHSILDACLTQPAPVVLLAGEPAAIDACDGAVFACLPEPVAESHVGPAVAMARRLFVRSQAQKEQTAELRQQLEDRKLVERAKGAIIRRNGLTEGEAYRRLRKYASDRNLKLAEVARTVLAAEEVFGRIDERIDQPCRQHKSGPEPE